ncbi:MAG: entericidin A/B family lipoprotein [Pseudomonadota bacterium]|nr:entericidin A/B family lipoprotein [Pseudomonadota bacterium]
MKNLVLATLVALTSLSLAACNTIRGAGQDVEEAGEEIQDATD